MEILEIPVQQSLTRISDAEREIEEVKSDIQEGLAIIKQKISRRDITTDDVRDICKKSGKSYSHVWAHMSSVKYNPEFGLRLLNIFNSYAAINANAQWRKDQVQMFDGQIEIPALDVNEALAAAKKNIENRIIKKQDVTEIGLKARRCEATLMKILKGNGSDPDLLLRLLSIVSSYSEINEEALEAKSKIEF
jgi:hypothetical protein